MALLSKSRNIDSSGHTFSRLSDTIFGGKVHKINRADELYNCDYIFVLKEEGLSSFDENEVGIDKNYCMIHDSDWNDEHKKVDHNDSRKTRLLYGELDSGRYFFKYLRTGD